MQANSWLRCDSGVAIVSYNGPPISVACLNATGTASTIQNIHLYCNRKCRGIRFDGATYATIASNVRIYDAVEVALDVNDCWGGNMRDVVVFGCDGIAIRTRRCNSVHYDNLRIANCTLGERWPSGIAERDKAAVSITGATDLNLWTNVLFEPVYCGNYPAVAATWHMSRMQNVRFEGGSFSGPMVRLQNTQPDDSRSARNITFEQVSITSKQPATSFLRVEGECRSVVVSQLYAARYLSKAICETDADAAANGICVSDSLAYGDDWKPLPEVIVN
jgi:hypothetical protein